MNLPITSRLKRVSALKKTRQQDSAIDPDNPSATVGGGTKSPDIITNESVTSEDPKLTSFKERCGKYGGVNSAAAAADGCVWSDDAKDPDPIVTNTQTTTPGEDSTFTGTLKTTTKGDVFNPWETRQQSRSIKKEQRDIRRAKIKSARKKGTLTSELRNKYKQEESDAELLEFEAAATRNSNSRASGKVGGTKDVVTGSRDTQRSERTPEQQKAQLKAEALAKKKAALLAEAEKKASTNKMRKNSPAKKSLVGAQNQLPPQLQASIKAAPGKKKSVAYKMKGSMFQKGY